jgi:hypothetical protein
MARERPGLLDYLDKRLGSHSGTGPEYQFHCPFCIDRLGDESNDRKLWFNVVKLKGVCYRCGYGASSLRALFLSLNGGKLLMEELALLKGERQPITESITKAVIKVLYGEDEPEVPRKRVAVPGETLWLWKDLDEPRPLAKHPLRYLRNVRGVDDWKIKHYRIGYCPTGTYAGYLVFPVYLGGEQVYFTTRFCGDSDLKSKNPKNVDGYHTRRTCLLNFDNVIGAPVVAIAEGPLSMMAHESGVATMGKFVSDEQVALLEVLAHYGTKEFVVSLDADAGRDADEVYQKLRDHLPKVTLLALDKGDPDDNREELPKLMEGRNQPGLADRVRLRLSGDALKTPRKMIAGGLEPRYTRRRNQRGGRK